MSNFIKINFIRLGEGQPKNGHEEVLATVTVQDDKYGAGLIELSGTGPGNNFGTRVKLFLRLAYSISDLSGVREVQIPDNVIVRHPNIETVRPFKAFRHDFIEHFDGP